MVLYLTDIFGLCDRQVVFKLGYRRCPFSPTKPAPGAPAELLAQLRIDRRAAQWVPAFEREWTAALEESRRTFSLAGLYEVVQDWQGRLSHALAVDASVAPGYDDSDFIDMAELRGRRR
ncbi:DUF6247 family protein [Streptomyces sp. NPDC016172]|uniref:DUF6247 family protein n=1 Tax=Streptomyces sp. NPDC016172 TaxID=3364964 RepID=UPI0036FE9613